MGIKFKAQVPEVAELTEGDPEQVVLENARRKALAVTVPLDALVLGVDTVVCCEGVIYGKPADAERAHAVLSRLSGRRHTVISGLCVADSAGVRTALATTHVHFRTLSAGLIDWYVASGEWRERAGGYAIQGRGAGLVRRIEGDYLNVVGLPLATLLELAPGLLAPAGSGSLSGSSG